MNDIKTKLMRSSRATKQDKKGKIVSVVCIGFILVLIVTILLFLTVKGLATFTTDKINPFSFLFGTVWNPAQNQVGALPMIISSFAVTLIAALIATPFAIAIGIYMTQMASKRGAKFLQPVIELLVGIPSVVYGFVGLIVIVPAIRIVFGGTGFGILAGSIVIFVMILPTIATLTIDAFKGVPKNYKSASLALGATRWQTIYKVLLRAALPGIMTAVVFGMARAFGEALAVQMVIGNSPLLPTSLVSPTSTLTSRLTTDMGNTVMGTLPNDALWSLALILLLMSLLFNVVVKMIAKRGRLK